MENWFFISFSTLRIWIFLARTEPVIYKWQTGSVKLIIEIILQILQHIIESWQLIRNKLQTGQQDIIYSSYNHLPACSMCLTLWWKVETTSLPLLPRLAIHSPPSPPSDFSCGNFSTCNFNSLLHVCLKGTPGVTDGV